MVKWPFLFYYQISFLKHHLDLEVLEIFGQLSDLQLSEYFHARCTSGFAAQGIGNIRTGNIQTTSRPPTVLIFSTPCTKIQPKLPTVRCNQISEPLKALSRESTEFLYEYGSDEKWYLACYQVTNSFSVRSPR